MKLRGEEVAFGECTAEWLYVVGCCCGVGAEWDAIAVDEIDELSFLVGGKQGVFDVVYRVPSHVWDFEVGWVGIGECEALDGCVEDAEAVDVAFF